MSSYITTTQIIVMLRFGISGDYPEGCDTHTRELVPCGVAWRGAVCRGVASRSLLSDLTFHYLLYNYTEPFVCPIKLIVY